MNQMPLILVAHSIRSAHNVGSLFRSGDGAGIEELLLSGISPHLKTKGDSRPPYVAKGAESAIAKTALGAERSLPSRYLDDPLAEIKELKRSGRKVYALEQKPGSTTLFDSQISFPSVLILGEELGGISDDLLEIADEIIEIPMYGSKDSLNVSAAAAIALFWMRSEFQKRTN